MEHFKHMVNILTQEYNDKQGYVTCEFSTSEDLLGDKLRYLAQQEVNHEGMWTIFYCETCKEYHEDSPFHVMIVRAI